MEARVRQQQKPQTMRLMWCSVSPARREENWCSHPCSPTDTKVFRKTVDYHYYFVFFSLSRRNCVLRPKPPPSSFSRGRRVGLKKRNWPSRRAQRRTRRPGDLPHYPQPTINVLTDISIASEIMVSPRLFRNNHLTTFQLDVEFLHETFKITHKQMYPH